MNKYIKAFIILFIPSLILIYFYLNSHNFRTPIVAPPQNVVQLTPQSSPDPNIVYEQAKVAFVIDGDTVELTDKRRVRYLGIDAPEDNSRTKEVQCFGEESKKANVNLVQGQEIGMEKDVSETDKYGRILRYVYLDGVMVNEFLLSQGFAKLEVIPPDRKYYSLFRATEKEARENKRGLWKSCN